MHGARAIGKLDPESRRDSPLQRLRLPFTRGDGGATYEGVGKVVYAAQRAGISRIGFITEPPPRGG